MFKNHAKINSYGTRFWQEWLKKKNKLIDQKGMKNLWIFAVGLSLAVSSCGNKQVAKTSVPESVVTSFYQRYPYAQDVDWEMSKGLYEADFKDNNGKSKEAFYRSDGTLVRVDD